MRNISLNAFSNYASQVGAQAPENLVIHVTNLSEGTVGGHDWVRLGKRDDAFKARNLTARTAFLDALMNHYGIKSTRQLPTAVREALNLDKFEVDTNGRVTSEKPLTLRRIRCVLNAVNTADASMRGYINAELEQRRQAAINETLTPAFKEELCDILDNLNGLNLNGLNEQKANRKLRPLFDCFKKHLTNYNFQLATRDKIATNDAETWLNFAARIYVYIRDRLGNEPMNGDTAFAIRSALERQIEKAEATRNERDAHGDQLSPSEFEDEALDYCRGWVLHELVYLLAARPPDLEDQALSAQLANRPPNLENQVLSPQRSA